MKRQYVTIQQDLMGSLHIWEGRPTVYQTEKYLFKTVKDDREAELFYQFEYDIQSILNHLPTKTVNLIKQGFCVVTTKFPMDYFPNC